MPSKNLRVHEMPTGPPKVDNCPRTNVTQKGATSWRMTIYQFCRGGGGKKNHLQQRNVHVQHTYVSNTHAYMYVLDTYVVRVRFACFERPLVLAEDELTTPG